MSAEKEGKDEYQPLALFTYEFNSGRILLQRELPLADDCSKQKTFQASLPGMKLNFFRIVLPSVSLHHLLNHMYGARKPLFVCSLYVHLFYLTNGQIESLHSKGTYVQWRWKWPTRNEVTTKASLE
jgi:hypothetical protein